MSNKTTEIENTRRQVTAKILLDWADELEELNIKHRFLGKTNRKRLQLLVKDLHIAAGVLSEKTR